VEAVLEAAHIHPYRGAHTNDVTNGLLLRADLHTLFDLKLLWIDEEKRIGLSDRLRQTPYWELRDQPLRLPRKLNERPSDMALRWHRDS
jgi:predicted restriction endonuclease